MFVHAHSGPPEEAQAPRMGEETPRSRWWNEACREMASLSPLLAQALRGGARTISLRTSKTRVDEMGDTFRRDGINNHAPHEFMLTRVSAAWGMQGDARRRPTPAGGPPPWTR